MKRLSWIAPLLVAITFYPAAASAQTNATGGTEGEETVDSDEDGIPNFWECQSPGGNFVVKLTDITSVSKHTYIVDGSARVYEVTVGTSGPMVGRFYYIEAVTNESPLAIGKITLDRLQDLANKATERTGTTDVWTEVVKSYPTTTHAKTAEYRISDVSQIEKIYNHIYRVWAYEKGSGKDNKIVVN